MIKQQPENTPVLDPSEDQVPWTIQQTFLGTFLTLLPWVILALALSSLGTTTSTRPLSPRADMIGAIVTIVFSAIIEGAFLIAPLYYAHASLRSIPHHGRLAIKALGFRSFSAPRALSWIVGLLLLVFAVNILYSYLITTFHLNLQTNDQVILAHSKEAPLTTYATLLAAVLIAPFCEEIFFRGFVFQGLRRSMPVSWAIVLSALLFAVAHADPGSFAVLFAIGIALAILRWRTKSIWPGMLLHMLNNGLGALIIVLTMQGIIK